MKGFEELGDRLDKVCDEIEENDGIKEGAHVRYIGIHDAHLEHPQYCGHPSDPRGILDFNTIYEIEYRIIARSFSLVKLVGFREYEFSPSIFEAINKNEEKKHLKAGGRVRYIGTGSRIVLFDGTGYGVLNIETIYEVEKVGKHHFGIGFPHVELVGFEGKFDRREFEKVAD